MKDQKLERKDKRAVISWFFKKVHEINPHCIPLHIIQGVVAVILIYFPIIYMKFLIEAAIAQNWRQLAYNCLIFVCGTQVLKMLNRYLEAKTEVIAVEMNGIFKSQLKLQAMQIDYHTATSPGRKEAFRLALENMKYEMGDFRTFMRRAMSILQNIISIITSLSLTFYLVFSTPEKDLNNSFLNLLARPTPSLISVVLLLTLAISLQLIISKSALKEVRKYLQSHSKYEAVLKYYIFEVAGSNKNYSLFQNYDMLPMLRDKIIDVSTTILKLFSDSIKRSGMSQVGPGVFAGITMITGYGLASLKAISGAIPLAALLTYANSFIQLNTAVSKFSTSLLYLNNSLPYFADIKNYNELENSLDTGSLPVEKRRDHKLEIEFENVSFSYPGSDKEVLKNVSLKLDMNKRHALVGPNGAGKSTLIYLLCRLYDPSEGRILLNGIDIRKYAYDEYLKIFSVVFQDFHLFAVPLSENVAASRDFDREKLIESLKRAGFKAHEKPLEDLLDQEVLTMENESAKFSGGELQKIAIARALYKDGGFVVLDEPTAALDPKSEAEIYEHLQNLIEDKTTIFISHRMSSCRLCEDIIVLDQGRIVERGTHEQLLKSKALYHEMWEAQAEYYR